MAPNEKKNNKDMNNGRTQKYNKTDNLLKSLIGKFDNLDDRIGMMDMCVQERLKIIEINIDNIEKSRELEKLREQSKRLNNHMSPDGMSSFPFLEGDGMVLQIDGNGKLPKLPKVLADLITASTSNKKQLKTSETEIEEDEESSDEEEYYSDEEFEEIDVKIGSVADLLDLVDKYYDPKKDSSEKTGDQKKCKFSVIDDKKYSINFEILYNIRPVLEKLNLMIGLGCIKIKIVEMILYYVQNFESKNRDMLHTVIEGPPGVGKTEVGRILAELYANLGITKSNNFRIVKRTDLIGQHIGQTDIKTQTVIDELDGGVLFIDEAYALGSEDKRDSFSKACIDILNHNLSENKGFICIIAGYPGELDKCFFNQNEGLKRRFPFRYRIDGYTSKELADIFRKMINDKHFKLSETVDEKLNCFFETHFSEFQYFGGDVENFVNKCKYTHSTRVFCKHPKHRRLITFEDIEQGMLRFQTNKKKEDLSWQHIYN